MSEMNLKSKKTHLLPHFASSWLKNTHFSPNLDISADIFTFFYHQIIDHLVSSRSDWKQQLSYKSRTLFEG